MQFSENTINILKNFATINQSICFKAGSQIRTRSASKDIYAIADLEETFPIDFSIYELNRLLNVTSLFDKPDFVFEESFVKVGAGRNCVKYFYSPAAVVAGTVVTQQDYARDIKMPAVKAEFDLKQAELVKIMKAAAVIGAPTITIRGKGGVLELVAHDKKNSSSDSFSLDLGATDVEFNADFKIESLKMIHTDYRVTVTENTISKFVAVNAPLTYFVAGEISV